MAPYESDMFPSGMCLLQSPEIAIAIAKTVLFCSCSFYLFPHYRFFDIRGLCFNSLCFYDVEGNLAEHITRVL